MSAFSTSSTASRRLSRTVSVPTAVLVESVCVRIRFTFHFTKRIYSLISFLLHFYPKQMATHQGCHSCDQIAYYQYACHWRQYQIQKYFLYGVSPAFLKPLLRGEYFHIVRHTVAE